MMTVTDFLSDLRKRDVALWLEGDRLRCSAPRNVLTPELQAQLALFKAEILDSLRAARDRKQTGPPPLQPAPRTGKMPLSFGQQRLWFLHQMDPESTVYNIHDSVWLEKVDVPLLEQALTELVRRHETLRTTFGVVDGDPVQIIAPPAPVALRVVDLRSHDAASRQAEAQRLKAENARAPFDLSRGPLFRFVLLRLSDDTFELLVTQHHIVTDGWSIALLYSEMARIYEALKAGRPHGLPELRIQYADYAYWQRRWLMGDVLAPQLAYWKKQLGGLAVLEIPTDHPRPATQTLKGALQILALPRHLSDALVTLSRDEGVTLYMVLLAAFKIVLAKYSGQTDIVTGTSNGNRTRTELEQIIGFFVNTQVLRVDLSGDPTLSEVLQRVSAVALDAYANQDVPFEKLVEELQPKRDLSRSPLFDVMFILQNTKLETLNRSATHNAAKALAAREHGGGTSGFATRLMTEGAGARVLIETGISKFDLTLYLMETNEGIRGSLEYNTDLFEHETMTRMLDHYETVLQALVENPRQRLSELSILTRVERERFESWQGRAQPQGHETLPELVAAQVARTPDAVAVVGGAGSLTYADLDRRSNQIAHRLRALGVAPGERVGVSVERSAAMVAALLGVIKAGGAYVPLDPAFPRDRLAYMLEDAGARVIVADTASAAELPAHGAAVVALDVRAEWTGVSDAPVPATARPEDVAYVIYTSGSTGKPKGVAIPHRAIVNFLRSMAEEPGLTSSDVLVAVTTLSFDIAGLELFLPLIVGARIEVVSRDEAADGAALQARLSSSGGTVLQATPATWRLLLEAGWQGHPGLRMFCGGETLPRDLADKLLAGGGALWNLYGPTETTVWSTAEQVPPGSAPITIGRPIANTQAYVLDSAGQRVPVGVLGELYLGGAGLAQGYLGKPGLTAERFVPDSVGSTPGGRLYRTGDVARWLPDGRLECLGRVDHQVKVRGFRIELGEIEAALVAHPAIRSAVVTVHPDAAGEKRLVAYVIPDVDPPPVVSDLRHALKARLPDYMIPSVFQVLQAFPQTPNGKIDRKALPAPDGVRPHLESNYVVPRNAVEQTIAAVWQEVLGVQSVGVFDNFFDLGGHSLLLVKAHGRLHGQFERELSIIDMFRYPTVDALAKHVSEAVDVSGAADASGAMTGARERAEKLKRAATRSRERNKSRKGSR
jgi:amino acid adenylation domain-containing protein